MSVDKELIKGSTSTLVLSVLGYRPMYGYQIIKELEQRSQGVFSFKEGTLYPVLHSLESAGMLTSYWVDSEEGRRRKYYQLTDQGRAHLQAKKQQWHSFSQAVEKVIGGDLICG